MEVERHNMGKTRFYIASDANLQWDAVELEITQGDRSVTVTGDAQEAYDLANAIIKASESAASKRRDMMKPA